MCGECASRVCRACHSARSFSCCTREEWKTMRQGSVSAAKVCDRARARWGLALTAVVSDVRRRAAVRAKWKEVVSLAVASGRGPAGECRRAGVCLLPFCSHVGHVRCATHLSERASEHRDVKKRSVLRTVTRATYAPAARRRVESPRYERGAVFTIRRGETDRVVQDDVRGMVVECTNAGYERAYLKLQLGYIGTNDACLRNEFMSERSPVAHGKHSKVDRESPQPTPSTDKKESPQPTPSEKVESGNYHWPHSGRDSQCPRPDETGDADVDAANEIRHFWRVAPEIWRRVSSAFAVWRRWRLFLWGGLRGRGLRCAGQTSKRHRLCLPGIGGRASSLAEDHLASCRQLTVRLCRLLGTATEEITEPDTMVRHPYLSCSLQPPKRRPGVTKMQITCHKNCTNWVELSLHTSDCNSCSTLVSADSPGALIRNQRAEIITLSSPDSVT